MRIALGVEYNGSRFFGWQKQSHTSNTVQGQLEPALEKVANHPVHLFCAGRTDTGVHATSQVVHFDAEVIRPERAWVFGVNSYLPHDISVLWASVVNDSFHARFSATARRYRYVILNRLARAALLNKQVSWQHGELNVNAMHEAAQALLGEQDFSSFRSAACQSVHANRFVHYVNVSREGHFVYIDIQANAFLHHMVRNIVGSLLMIGHGERPVSWLGQLLQFRDRTRAGPTAPADGLYLVGVDYPTEYDLPNSDCQPRLFC